MPDMAESCDVLICGGGASGMMAAIGAAMRKRRVILLEKNEKLGKKLFITGKGRCNLTNNCPEAELMDNIVSNPRFMYSSLRNFSNTDVMAFFEALGLRLKTERGGRVFPLSDHSSDVIRALEKRLRELDVDIRLKSEIKELLFEEGDKRCCTGARVKDSAGGLYLIKAGSVIVATGGASYPATGSSGDGYSFAREAGLQVIPASPSLVPFETEGELAARLQGLSLKNVKVRIKDGDRKVWESREPGEMLFTHFGVSGPMILTASSDIRPELFDKGLSLHIDLKPALSLKELDDRILRDFKESLNKEYKNALNRLLPSKLIPVITGLSGIDPYKKVNGITVKEREALAGLLKDLSLRIKGVRGFDEAIITRGGVSVKELDPKTFEAKKIRGLYFAGEVIDVDAHTGGFNLQIAWSSGYAAGSYA